MPWTIPKSFVALLFKAEDGSTCLLCIFIDWELLNKYLPDLVELLWNGTCLFSKKMTADAYLIFRVFFLSASMDSALWSFNRNVGQPRVLVMLLAILVDHCMQIEWPPMRGEWDMLPLELDEQLFPQNLKHNKKFIRRSSKHPSTNSLIIYLLRYKVDYSCSG